MWLLIYDMIVYTSKLKEKELDAMNENEGMYEYLYTSVYEYTFMSTYLKTLWG